MAGISTVVIGLIKLHLEKTRPPRALWVPFELGRPIGAPMDPRFQRQVLVKALQLVESAKQPVIEDFTDEDPRSIDCPDWRPPVIATHLSVTDECIELKPWYQRQCVDKSRTSVGVAGAPIADLAALFDAVYDGKEGKKIRPELSDRLMLRYAIDDLKAYYVEAAMAERGSPSSRQIYDWLWQSTLLGSRMRELRHRFVNSDDDKLIDMGNKFIVPHQWRD